MTTQVTASIQNGSELDSIGYGTVSARILQQERKDLNVEVAAKLDLILASATHSKGQYV